MQIGVQKSPLAEVSNFVLDNQQVVSFARIQLQERNYLSCEDEEKNLAQLGG